MMRSTVFLSGAAVLLTALPVQAQSEWQTQKCAIYERAWTRALENFGDDNINYNFIATNENFIASGCTDTIRACPRSERELEIANVLSIVMMNEGVASTFLPFGCPSD